MKKFFILLLSFMFMILPNFISACGDKETTISFYAPDGAPAFAVSPFILDNENFGLNNIEYKIVSQSNIGQALIKGEAEIVVAPINLATKLYNSNESDIYQMVSVITHGNLFIMSTEELNVADLKGKVVGVIGKGLVPDLTLKSVLLDNGVSFSESETVVSDKVALKYYADGSEILPALKTHKINIGLVPEPLATKLSALAPEFKYRLSLQTLFDNANGYPQAVMLVKKSLLDAYPDLVSNIESKFISDSDILNSKKEQLISAINSHLSEGITPSLLVENVNSDVINGCNIYFESASCSKPCVNKYIDKLLEIDGSSAKKVSDEFFYEK